ncbi:hypothetical protein LF887_17205 [Chryseobacterium sp. MEBOG06]|uniref:DUF4262 domain-containing protein n=1 Tax=Chryseobacterium sp. MEBOG06 TaxID=2879938 RepID=UPI001F21FA57|nr:hypothetical protein [Chryseobacterium sp. MEBOG06]UKB82741.1 hypothetical protein LF887_17205 [Chryseobacterium sp. MEBOG06]
MNKAEFLSNIKSHIKDFGYHVTIVTGNSPLPKYYYTIGLNQKFKFELAFAGGAIYKNEEIKKIINFIVEKLNINTFDNNFNIQLDNLGSFTISLIHESWSHLMFDGIFDYYGSSDIKVFQIIPDTEHKTLEIPDMSIKFDEKNQPVWQWLVKDWIYPIDQNSIVFTDIDALFGKKILELMRWEESEWEMFTDDGTQIPKHMKRAVSFGTILGIDDGLNPAMYLPIEKGLRRENGNSEWNNWG